MMGLAFALVLDYIPITRDGVGCEVGGPPEGGALARAAPFAVQSGLSSMRCPIVPSLRRPSSLSHSYQGSCTLL